MFVRHLLLALLGATAIAVAACAESGSSSAPSRATPRASDTAPGSPGGVALRVAPIDAPAPSASDSPDLPGFCAQIAHPVIASWPNLDPMVAASLGPAMNDWAMRPEVASLQEDLATVAMWLLASAGAAASPPADIQVAVDHLRTFAKTNC